MHDILDSWESLYSVSPQWQTLPSYCTIIMRFHNKCLDPLFTRPFIVFFISHFHRLSSAVLARYSLSEGHRGVWIHNQHFEFFRTRCISLSAFLLSSCRGLLKTWLDKSVNGHRSITRLYDLSFSYSNIIACVDYWFGNRTVHHLARSVIRIRDAFCYGRTCRVSTFTKRNLARRCLLTLYT